MSTDLAIENRTLQTSIKNQLIKNFKAIVLSRDSKPHEVADLFLQIVKESLETMGPDPQTAIKLLFTIIYL